MREKWLTALLLVICVGNPGQCRKAESSGDKASWLLPEELPIPTLDMIDKGTTCPMGLGFCCILLRMIAVSRHAPPIVMPSCTLWGSEAILKHARKVQLKRSQGKSGREVSW